LSALSVLVAGAARQGVEETADLLARAALLQGLEARRASTRALSRTAGSTLCQVRIARGPVHSPFVAAGEADLLLAVERIEALRQIHQVRRTGFVAVADALVPTPRMREGLEGAPADLIARLRAHVPRTAEVGTSAIARQVGGPVGAGVVLLGLAAPLLPIGDDAWNAAIDEQCAPDDRPAWRLAFATGRSLFEGLPPELRLAPAEAPA